MADDAQQPPGNQIIAWDRQDDKQNERMTEEMVQKLFKNINAWYAANGVSYITDPDAIAAVTEVVTKMKHLYLRYEDADDFKRTSDFEDGLIGINYLDTLKTLRELKSMSDSFIRIMAINHGFKDATKKKAPWDDVVKKKYRISPLSSEEEEFMKKHCDYRWKRLCFYWTHMCVKDNNDVHTLFTGVNNSGKTNMDIMMMATANKYFREFWHVEELPGVPLHKFNMKTDVIYAPDPDAVNKRLGIKKFQTVAVVEGMGANLNLKSLNKETIEMGVNAFRKRFQNCIVGYEYQVNDRATKLLMERFTTWIQKMGKKHSVLSIPSPFINKKDKFYFAELDDLRSDDQMSYWIQFKNPNYAGVMYAPKMGVKRQKKFEEYRQITEEDLYKAKETKTTFKDEEYSLIHDIYEREADGSMARIDIPTYLREEVAWEDDKRIGKFMRKYEDYVALMKIRTMRKKKGE